MDNLFDGSHQCRVFAPFCPEDFFINHWQRDNVHVVVVDRMA